MNLMEILEQAGVDVETTLHRFMGNGALLERFVKKFAEDPTYDRLCAAFAAKDLSGMETEAHTLKGTAANLGFQALGEKSAVLVHALRGDESDAETLRVYCDAIDKEYHRIMELIAQID